MKKENMFTMTLWKFIHMLSIIVFFAVACITDSPFKGVIAVIIMEIISWLCLNLIPIICKIIFRLIPILYLILLFIICAVVYILTFGGRVFDVKDKMDNEE